MNNQAEKLDIRTTKKPIRTVEVGALLVVDSPFTIKQLGVLVLVVLVLVVDVMLLCTEYIAKRNIPPRRKPSKISTSQSESGARTIDGALSRTKHSALSGFV